MTAGFTWVWISRCSRPVPCPRILKKLRFCTKTKRIESRTTVEHATYLLKQRTFGNWPVHAPWMGISFAGQQKKLLCKRSIVHGRNLDDAYLERCWFAKWFYWMIWSIVQISSEKLSSLEQCSSTKGQFPQKRRRGVGEDEGEGRRKVRRAAARVSPPRRSRERPGGEEGHIHW